MSGDSEFAVRMMNYVAGVLDAIGITNGSTHSEIIVDAAGTPCLVESNCRTNGGDGLWVPLAEGLYGYSQVSALLDAYFDAEAFEKLPPKPPALTRQGVVGHIVSYQEGIMVAAPAVKELEALPSHVTCTLAVEKGDHVAKTIDFFTDAGVFVLLSDDHAQLEEDYAKAHSLMEDGNFFKMSDSDESTVDSSPRVHGGQWKVRFRPFRLGGQQRNADAIDRERPRTGLTARHALSWAPGVAPVACWNGTCAYVITRCVLWSGGLSGIMTDCCDSISNYF